MCKFQAVEINFCTQRERGDLCGGETNVQFLYYKIPAEPTLLLTVDFCDCPNSLHIEIILLQENSDSLNHTIYNTELRESETPL